VPKRVMGSDPALQLRDVEKQYGSLRPLRIRDLRVASGDCVMLIGFDRPAAETFFNLITGTALPERGEVVVLGHRTGDIVDGEEWLSSLERFGSVCDRSVLLEAMTIAQNLAISFDLQLDPIPAAVLTRVARLARAVDIDASLLDRRLAEMSPALRARVHLGRALALDPAILVLEHPTATLPAEDAPGYASLVKEIWERRRLTIVGLTMDEKFAKATGGRLLSWQPATGELRKKRWTFISRRSP
jgi:ABC-type transporter Mla maintaining outer membrane lipid asymmetry ATPase subunit MlaF